MKTSRVVRLGIAAICLVASVSTARAQVNEARFTGTVLDPSGSAVPGAPVTVTNERTGDVRTATANAEGRFVVTGLRPSVYTIATTFANFAPLEYKGMQLLAAQEFALDLQLKAAGVTETVTVVGESTAIDVGSARIGVNVSEREIQNLPVNGRQMSQLMLQSPGSQNAGTGTWNDVRFSGRANQQNVIKFDGVEGSAIIDAAPGNLGGQIPAPFKLQASLENVQEFRVEQPGAAGRQLHRQPEQPQLHRGGGHVRAPDRHSRPHGRPRHAETDSVRGAVLVLRIVSVLKVLRVRDGANGAGAQGAQGAKGAEGASAEGARVLKVLGTVAPALLAPAATVSTVNTSTFSTHQHL